MSSSAVYRASDMMSVDLTIRSLNPEGHKEAQGTISVCSKLALVFRSEVVVACAYSRKNRGIEVF